MIHVTCAVIRNEENEVLVVQRGEATDHPLKWEFPGGKLIPGETEEECIIREVYEELSMDIVICGKLPVVNHDYGHKKIRLIPYICDTLDGLPLLTEHIGFRWIHDSKLLSVDLSEADIFVAKSYIEIIAPHVNNGIQIEPVPADPPVVDEDLMAMVNNMMSMKEAEWVAVSAIENPAIFLKLLEFSHSSDKKLAFHSSWTLTKVCDKFPELIYPYIHDLVASLDRLEHESALRSFLRIISLSEMDRLNNSEHGILADFCFNTLKSGFTAIAVKAYSMEILYRLSLIYPELANELSASIRILLEDGSAGINARGRMILKKISEIPLGPESNQSLS